MAIKITDSSTGRSRQSGAVPSVNPQRVFGQDSSRNQVEFGAVADKASAIAAQGNAQAAKIEATGTALSSVAQMVGAMYQRREKLQVAEDNAILEKVDHEMAKEEYETNRRLLDEMNSNDHTVEWYETNRKQEFDAMAQRYKGNAGISTDKGKETFDQLITNRGQAIELNTLKVGNEMRTEKAKQQMASSIDAQVWKAKTTDNFAEIEQILSNVSGAVQKLQAVDPTISNVQANTNARVQHQRILETFVVSQAHKLNDALEAKEIIENNSDLFLSVYDPEDLDKLVANIDKIHSDQIKDKASQQKVVQAAVKAQQDNRAHLWMVGIEGDSDVGFEPTSKQLYEDLISNAISDVQYRKISNHLDKKRGQVEDFTDTISWAIDNQSVLDPSSSHDKKAVEWFIHKQVMPQLLSQGVEQNAIQKTLVKTYGDLGVIDSRQKSQVNRLIQSNDPEQVSLAATFVHGVVSENPKMTNQFTNQQLDAARLYQFGVSSNDISEILKSKQSVNKDQQKAIKKSIDSDQREKLYNDQLEDTFDGDQFSSQGVSTAMRTKYDQLFDDYLVMSNGNSDFAATRAMDHIRSIYSTSDILGDGTIMPYSPEHVYNNGQKAQWMYDQFDRDLQSAGVDKSDITLQFTNDKRYLVIDKDSGLPVMDDQGNHMLWRPDKNDPKVIEQINLEKMHAIDNKLQNQYDAKKKLDQKLSRKAFVEKAHKQKWGLQ